MLTIKQSNCYRLNFTWPGIFAVLTFPCLCYTDGCCRERIIQRCAAVYEVDRLAAAFKSEGISAVDLSFSLDNTVCNPNPCIGVQRQVVVLRTPSVFGAQNLVFNCIAFVIACNRPGSPVSALFDLICNRGTGKGVGNIFRSLEPLLVNSQLGGLRGVVNRDDMVCS